MRFNALGEALTGLGKRWLTDTRQIFQSGSDATGWNLVDQFGARIADGGASLLAAGGGKWAASLQINPIDSRSNFGYASRVGWIWDIALDGSAIVECPDYQAGNQVGLLGGPYVTGDGVYDARAFPGGFAACLGHRVFSSTHGWITTPPGVTVFSVCQVGDVLLYTTHAWLVLQRIGSLHGRVVAPAPAFYPDMVSIDGQTLRIGYTETQGDTGLHLEVVTRTSLSDDLSGLRDVAAPPSPSIPAPQPPSIPAPQPAPISVSVPDRSAFVAAFLGSRLARFDAEREKTREHTFEQVNALCLELRRQDTRWGLLAKPTGPRGRSADVLLYKLSEAQARVIDVVADSEGDSGIPRPYWELKDLRAAAEWKEPFPVGGHTEGGPAPMMPPAGSHPAVDAGRVAVLERQLAALQATLAQQQQVIEELKARVNGIVTLPKRVALKGAHGHYVTAEDNQSVTNRSDDRGQWEIFELEPIS
jgi:hypothetical protein